MELSTQALSSEKGQERAGDSGGDDLLQAQKGIVISGKLENEEAGVRGEGPQRNDTLKQKEVAKRKTSRMKGGNVVDREDSMDCGIKIIWQKQEEEKQRGFMVPFS